MAQFKITPQPNLAGEIEVYGAKNAAMKIIAASVMISGVVVLENVPDIADIQTIIDILVKNGAKIQRRGHQVAIDTSGLSPNDPDDQLVKKMRGTIVLLGPYLARFGHIAMHQPGGCAIGQRPVNLHLDAFRQMGIEATEESNSFSLRGKLHAAIIEFPKVSVTATENIIMAAALTPGNTIIKNAAKEPEVADLINFLNSCGAKITGAGTSEINVTGVPKLSSTSYKVMPDRIEAGTFVALAVISRSNLKITNCRPQDLTAFLDTLQQNGVKIETGDDFIQVTDSENISAMDIETAEYPGFPTDLQAPMGLIMTQAHGKSSIYETIFENRLNYLKVLATMGARINIIDARRAEIIGPTPLAGKHIDSLDLRAGATLILAGLIATGETVIADAEIIDRGYEKIEERLQKIGADIKRIV